MVELRPLSEDDTRIVFAWQTDPQTRRYFRNPQPPSWDKHPAWIRHMVLSETDHIFIMERQGQKAGMLRLSPWPEDLSALEVSILVAPESYGQGIASAALDAAVKKFSGRRLIADVHRDNAASIRLFEKCGFVKTGEDEVWLHYERKPDNV